MKTLLKQEVSLQWDDFGPDPILLKKSGNSDPRPRDISEYKKKIIDQKYLDHAIDRIAMELSHFLAK